MPGYRVTGRNDKGSSVTRKYWAADETEALAFANQEGIKKATAKFLPATESQLENIKKYNLQVPDNCCQLAAKDIIERSVDGCQPAPPELRKLAKEKGWRGSVYIGEHGILRELDLIATPSDAAYIFVAAVEAYASNRKLSTSSLFEKDKKLERIANLLAQDNRFLSSILKQYPISDCLRFSFSESSEGEKKLSKKTKVYLAAREMLTPTGPTIKTNPAKEHIKWSENTISSANPKRKPEPSGCAVILAFAAMAPAALIIAVMGVIQFFTFS